MGQLDGRVALVTGAGSGIGKGIAEAFAREGASLVLAGRTLAKVEAVAEALRGESCSAQAFEADVSKHADCERLVAQTVKRFGALHLLVNNAGWPRSGRWSICGRKRSRPYWTSTSKAPSS